MKWVELGTIATVLNGYAFKSKEYVSSGIRVIRITNVQKGFVADENPKFVGCERQKEFERFLLESGDVLISLTGNVGRVGRIQSTMLPAALNQRVGAIKISSKDVDSDYIFQLLNSDEFERKAIKNSKGIAQLNLSSKWIEKYQIPLPPLAEQKRIAGILDAADALRAKRKQALAHLDDLLQSTFLTLFGDPVTNPMGWERASLGEITSIEAPMVDPRDAAFCDLLHFGPDRIEKGTGNLLPAQTAKEDDLISGKFLCHPGEILYSKIRPNLNKVALVQERCLCSADVYPVLPSSSFANKEYLFTLLRSSAFLDYVAGFSRRANIPKLNRKQFAGYKAPLPPLPLQQRFAAIVEKIEAQKARHRAHLAELDTLFASLQSRAFAGEL